MILIDMDKEKTTTKWNNEVLSIQLCAIFSIWIWINGIAKHFASIPWFVFAVNGKIKPWIF